jgi:hypothetical protein
MTTALLLFLIATPGPAAAGPAPSPAAPASGALAQSTMTVASLYTGDRVRDPFVASSGSGVAKRRPAQDLEGGEPEVVDIHGFSLRGILKDADTDFALFAAEGGGTFLLRGGRLYDARNKPVPGITGRIKLKQKTVELVTADKDVQVFRLGEDEKKDAAQP